MLKCKQKKTDHNAAADDTTIQKGAGAMNNTHLETFIRIVEAGSFNKAAEELYITSTAVIKQINLLENEIGVQLFERTHRGLKLT